MKPDLEMERVLECSMLDELRVLLGSELDDIVGHLTDQLPSQLAALETAVRGDDLRGVRELAHAMKGSAGNLGGRILAARAGRIELAAHGGDGAAVSALLPGLACAVADTIAALEAYVTAGRS